MVYVIQVCWQLSANLSDIYHCCVYSENDDGQRNCPKHVEVYSKNKFEKLVRLAGFIIRTIENVASACMESRNTKVMLYNCVKATTQSPEAFRPCCDQQ